MRSNIKPLSATNPKLAKEWHPTKNGNLTSRLVAQNSHKKVWWLGKCGHEWQAIITNRNRGRGCPYCSGKKANSTNSLLATNPEVAKEWHPTKNGRLTPNDVTSGSSRKTWWLAKCGHEWEAVINSRCKGHGCPYCSGRFSTKEDNLLVKNPQLAKEWHPTKNGKLKPRDVKCQSNLEVWWLSKCGHEWKCFVYARNNQSQGCPYCSYRRVNNTNSLSVLNPELAKQWHPTKNGNLTPNDVTCHSGKQVWWLGSCGHEWEAVIFSRHNGRGCHYCNSWKVSDTNSLSASNPELAKEWHHTRNKDLTPNDVKRGTNKKVWWLGKCGHEWESSINNRSQGSGCPYCIGHKVNETNAIAYTHPNIAREWHPTKNKVKNPYIVTAGSNYVASWICQHCQYEWRASVCNRTRESVGLSGRKKGKFIRGSSCPSCHEVKQGGWDDSEDFCGGLNILTHEIP